MASILPHERGVLAAPGPFTDLGPHAARARSLPPDVPGLCRVVQGLLIHPHHAHRYGFAVPAEREGEVQIRRADAALARAIDLGGDDLASPRPPEKRVVGNCRHHAVLLTAFLRARGVPARARCGFGAYFTPGKLEDHWICEWWDDARGRWVRSDPQIDEVQRAGMGIGCDVLDLAPDDFLVAGEAWRRCREGGDDPQRYGIFDMWGLWFVRGNLVRDLAAIAAKIELLPWDWWGVCEKEDADLDAADLAALDAAARLTAEPAPGIEALETRYADPRFRVPRTIRTWANGAMGTVDLALGV